MKPTGWPIYNYDPSHRDATLAYTTQNVNSHKYFKTLYIKRKILLEELHVLGIIEEGRALGVEESMKKVEIVSDLERSTLMEEVGWRQKI